MDVLAKAPGFWWYNAGELSLFAKEHLEAGGEFSPELVAVIRRTIEGNHWGNDGLKKVAARLDGPVLNVGEAWSDQVLAELAALGGGWRELITHAAQAKSAKPSSKWDTQALKLLETVGLQPFHDKVLQWLSLVGKPRTIPLQHFAHEPDTDELLDPFNVNALRGLLWALSLTPPTGVAARALAALVETSLKKIPGTGPRSPKLANAAVFALWRMDGEAALAQLARLALRVTFKGTLKEVHGALDLRAKALNLSRDEVEELAVPGYEKRTEFGAAYAEISIDNGVVSVAWYNEAGKPVKAPPASVKAAHAAELKEFKARVKDLEKMLTAQAERLDRQFLARRVWRFDAWRERYLDHALMGALARRLLWTVDGTVCCFADNALRRIDDTEVSQGGQVELWHPVGRPAQEVTAWRDWLERHGITQPFKQVHREVYPLTEAERATRVYSNRFAAHILRQHQFHALATLRGWRDSLRLMVDDTFPPATRELEPWGLRAEFWVEGIGDTYGTDTTESGTFHRVATDQVRFYPIGAPGNLAHAVGGRYEQWVDQESEAANPLPLEEIPPLVLSEVLRDVDLFVGVASVGNDPTWEDGGPDGRFREYWNSYSFGELSATAQTRKALLERLVPRLAIADRASIDGRFLQVRGDLRTYKIHLGSSNILMDPGNQYLCIVPTQTRDKVSGLFLPFDGDATLAVILSKALMLARDTTITDPTITQQIRPGS
jgi:Domain of unknown function (DUF4132)